MFRTHRQEEKNKVAFAKASKKKSVLLTPKGIASILFFGFFIGLSIADNNLFLTEILVGSSIIFMLVFNKRTI